jgi:hypothetical protein
LPSVARRGLILRFQGRVGCSAWQTPTEASTFLPLLSGTTFSARGRGSGSKPRKAPAPRPMIHGRPRAGRETAQCTSTLSITSIYERSPVRRLRGQQDSRVEMPCRSRQRGASFSSIGDIELGTTRERVKWAWCGTLCSTPGTRRVSSTQIAGHQAFTSSHRKVKLSENLGCSRGYWSVMLKPHRHEERSSLSQGRSLSLHASPYFEELQALAIRTD